MYIHKLGDPAAWQQLLYNESPRERDERSRVVRTYIREVNVLWYSSARRKRIRKNYEILEAFFFGDANFVLYCCYAAVTNVG